MLTAFISHSSPDDSYVAELEQLVRGLGYEEVFNDSHSIAPDEDFWPRVEEGIRDCDAFVVVLSQHSVASYWVEREVEFARAEGKKVIPVRIDDCEISPVFDGRNLIDLRLDGGNKQQIAEQKFARHAAEDFLGREDELALLDRAWEGADTVNVLSIIAWGGVGKTALISRWIQTRFAEKDWKNAEGEPDPLRYFDWTFYDQGTRADDDEKAGAASVGAFFEKALLFFGDEDPNLPGKGERLARLVQRHKSLLVLDGLEPLQYPINHPQAGQLTDPDLHDLLCTLAMQNPGLCVVTSRQALRDLTGLRNSTARQENLDELPVDVAVRLLRKLQVIGTDAELAKAAGDFDCHALSLILLGRFLFAAKGGDIRKRDVIKLEKADEKTRNLRNRNAWRVLEAYEEWLASPEGTPEDLETLRLTGLFDRPASPDCLRVLRDEPAIAGLTERLVSLDDDDWNLVLRRLDEAQLIHLRFPEGETVATEPREVPLDAHPLIREYFAQQLHDENSDAFRAAHSRLFDHLCENTEHQPDTLEGLQPLYQAVVHGCLAGRQQEACEKVYRDRILRGTGTGGFYTTKKLGAIGADLAAVIAFFDQPWSSLSENLSETAQYWLLSEAATRLHALGRLGEAVGPMNLTLAFNIRGEQWSNAALVASNLSELEVSRGRLEDAVDVARRAIDFADRFGEANLRCVNRTTAADALHQAGKRDEACALFEEAETILRNRQPGFDLLHSTTGFRYSDLLLSNAERAAWRRIIDLGAIRPEKEAEGREIVSILPNPNVEVPHQGGDGEECIESKLQFENNPSPLSIGLDHLVAAQSVLLQAILNSDRSTSFFGLPYAHLSTACKKLRDAGDVVFLVRFLLTAALHHYFIGDPDTARRFLDEAEQIAERGPMPLYLADVHLHRARLFRDRDELKQARALIQKHGYGRRKEELEDAEEAAEHWRTAD